MKNTYGTICYSLFVLEPMKGMLNASRAVLPSTLKSGIYSVTFTDQKILAKNINSEAEQLLGSQVSNWGTEAFGPWTKLKPLLADKQQIVDAPSFQESELSGIDLIIPYDTVTQIRVLKQSGSFLGMFKSNICSIWVALGMQSLKFSIDFQIADKVTGIIQSSPLSSKYKA